MDIYRKFTAALESLGVRGGVIVAFSGGADSTCLLSLFCTAAARGDFPYPLAAAHLNHGLRGEEAARGGKARRGGKTRRGPCGAEERRVGRGCRL